MLPDDRRLFVADMAARYSQRLQRFLSARLRNAGDVADLAQEVFLRLLRVEHHDLIRNPESYLLTIASHVIHQHALNGASNPPLVDVMEALDESRLVIDGDAAERLHMERRLEALDRALSRMSPKARAAFVLQRRDGCTIDEICQRLGVSRTMVKKYLARVVAQCSRQIQDCEKAMKDAP